MMWIRRYSARFTLWAALGFGIGLLAAGGPAWAQDPLGRVSIGGNAAGGVFALGDVNDRIDQANSDYLRARGWKTLGSADIGFGFAGDLRARVYGPLSLSIGGGTLTATTELDFDEVISVNPTATFLQARVDYDLPWRPLPKVRLRLGAAAINATSAECEVRHEVRRVEGGTLRIETATFEGSGWGGQVILGAEYTMTEKITLTADLAYRQLSVDRDKFSYRITEIAQPAQDTDRDGVPNEFDLDLDTVDDDGDRVISPNTIVGSAFLETERYPSGDPIHDADGRPVVRARGLEKIDFSGPMLHVGLRFYLF